MKPETPLLLRKRRTGLGPIRLFACVRSCVASARRGRQCPARAHAVAVCASRRLHCDARPEVASQNSLRSLRSLRSNSRDESDNEARCARRPRACAHQRHRNRPRRAPPAAQHRHLLFRRIPKPVQQRRVRAGWSAPLGRREAQGSWPRAQRASTTISSPLFECSERSERSEFGDGAMRPSIAGQSARSADRSSEARRPARTRLCRANRDTHGRRLRTAAGRKRTLAAPQSLMRRAPCEARGRH
jgi:hypothetical protein